MSKKKRKGGFNSPKKQMAKLIGLQESELGLPSTPSPAAGTGYRFRWTHLLNPITILSFIPPIAGVCILTNSPLIMYSGMFLDSPGYWINPTVRLQWGSLIILVSFIVGSAPFWRIWDAK